MFKPKERIEIEFKYSLFRSNIKQLYVRDFRKHDSFVYYLKGGQEFDFYGKKIIASAGEMLYLPYGSSYTNRAISSDTEYYQIEFDMFDGGKNASFFDKARVIPKSSASKYLTIFSEIHSHYVNQHTSYSLFCISSILRMLGMLVAELEEEKKASYHEFDRIAPAVTHINEHYELETSLDELAKISCTGISSLEKDFKRCLGMPPITYRNKIRVEHAKQLIGGGMSIEETAKLVGFSDRYYFSKVFKRFTGVSPGRFMKNCEI